MRTRDTAKLSSKFQISIPKAVRDGAQRMSDLGDITAVFVSAPHRHP